MPPSMGSSQCCSARSVATASLQLRDRALTGRAAAAKQLIILLRANHLSKYYNVKAAFEFLAKPCVSGALSMYAPPSPARDASPPPWEMLVGKTFQYKTLAHGTFTYELILYNPLTFAYKDAKGEACVHSFAPPLIAAPVGASVSAAVKPVAKGVFVGRALS